MCHHKPLLGLVLMLGLGLLLSPSAHGQIGVETVKLGYQDATGNGTLRGRHRPVPARDSELPVGVCTAG